MRDFPARDEEHAALSANDLCRRIIVRELDQRKRELLGEVQRVAPESEEGRAVRLRLRDIDEERRVIAGE